MSLFALSTAWFAAIILPGPDLFQIIRLGTGDRRAGVLCALGIMLGNSLWIIGSLLGLSAALAALPGALVAIQIVGGCYITWIGISSLCAGLQHENRELQDDFSQQEVTSQKIRSDWAALRVGVVTNLSNPKAVVFFAAIFAQFLRPDVGVWWSVCIAAFLILSGLCWFVGFALGVTAVANRLLSSTKPVDLTAGMVFVFLGTYMLVAGVRSIWI